MGEKVALGSGGRELLKKAGEDALVRLEEVSNVGEEIESQVVVPCPGSAGPGGSAAASGSAAWSDNRGTSPDLGTG